MLSYRAMLKRTISLLLVGLCAGPALSVSVIAQEAHPAAMPSDPALAAIDAFIAKSAINKKDESWRTHLPAPPKLEFSEDKLYFWVLETNKGELKLELLHKIAPMHASATIYLSRLGFYDGLNFHRIINRFMAQGGCPLGTGTGTPGFQISQELSSLVRHDGLGVLSAANRGKGTKEGSQFFITFGPTPHLNGVHTIYGQLVDGQETLAKIEALGSQSGDPRQAVEILSSKIVVEEDPVASMPNDHDSEDAAIAGTRLFIEEQSEAKRIDPSRSSWRTSLPKPEQQSFTEGKTYRWNLMTNRGLMRIELFPGVAPMHVSSTIYLTLLGFYDGLSFHRVIPGFMAQGGCPKGDGSGFPGFKMGLEVSPDVKHSSVGILSAANLGRDGTDGSQFFLTFGPTPHLDGGYTVYGKLSEGFEVLKALEREGTRSGRTRSPLKILKATITVD